MTVLLAATASCQKYEFEPPDRQERVQAAEVTYSPALFDTIAWDTDEARALEGSEVFAAKCRNCHGTLGEGDTEYGRMRKLTVPSLVEADWPYAASIDSVRHRIFVGHEAGMPTWGVAGITPREIDGVALYLLEHLRREMLGG